MEECIIANISSHLKKCPHVIERYMIAGFVIGL